MFSSVGWGEILVLFVVGLVLVGPERLPKLIADVRAMLLAARTAINDAKSSLEGELGEDFEDLRKPLEDINQLRSLNPRTAITRTLFDGDDTYLDLLTGKPAAGGNDTAARAAAADASAAGAAAAGAGATQGQAPTASAASTQKVPAQPAAQAASTQQVPAQPAAQANGAAVEPAPEAGPRNVTSWVDDDVM